MGFFDRLAGKKPSAAPTPSAESPAASATVAAAAGGVIPRLAVAREKLAAGDLPGALAIYEEVLAAAGDRADVLVAISGDLGSQGHVAQIIELVAPRYDAERHGPATGLNLLQAYLVTRNPDAAQHVLDILFSLNRPELEDRLHGFSNAIAELIHERHMPLDPAAVENVGAIMKVSVVSISKPVWFYGLEPMAAQLLPPKEGRLRRIAFVQLALPGRAGLGELAAKPEDEAGRLTRTLPLWFAEMFYFSKHYAPVMALGVTTRPAAASHYTLFEAEWTETNFRQLVETTGDGLDYIVAGALRAAGGEYELVLRVVEVKKFRERKAFTTRWTAATMDAALTQLQNDLRAFMEWSPAGVALAYTPTAQPRLWLETLGASLGLFLAGKSLLPKEQLADPAAALAQAAQGAAAGEVESLAFLTLRARAAQLGVATAPADVPLANSPLVAQAAGLPG